ncbi:TonB-dependent copper receptor [Microbulbifer sp. 2205BS26-8]|uniref:TonB-dependent copper receptor n=1 Tax=Microbulbifer sp. 2205BS26-8 TaxID=3064386 RepID=UPI00273DC40B|nr:TonB-dependent copper receptor [Microbulbifer sp. 2205BS26-8]MDP5209678.1 TonB-dependent copper receptor [Microbulbifer sp. 2205BS26-8]
MPRSTKDTTKEEIANTLKGKASLRIPLSLIMLAGWACPASLLANGGEMEEMVVTGVRTELPLNLVTDPKLPRQPLPANDGADYLKTIPGFSVVRKGGTSGDPLLRGMGGSRLGLLLDGESIVGSGSGRMDPPTAYLFPESLDEIEVIKGPQTVLYGPGNSTGVALFKQLRERPTESAWDMHASLLGGNAERTDGLFDIAYKSPVFSLRSSAASATANDYKDGDGNHIHSQYSRWNGKASLAWTPDSDTRLELGSTFSDGEAAFADRGLDGTKFARESYRASYFRRSLGDLLNTIELQGYFTYIDHVMDNNSLRALSAMPGRPIAMNLDSETYGAKLSLLFTPLDTVELTTGLDTRNSRHSSRMSMNQNQVDYRRLPRREDAEFSQVGIFSEARWQWSSGQRWIAGARLDDWKVRDLRKAISLAGMSSVDNPTAGVTRKELLHSGFLRYEHSWQNAPASSTTVFAGLGYSERSPDYWEIFVREAEDSFSALDINAEKTTQLDVGVIYDGENASASLSIFANDIRDYLIVQTGYRKPAIPSDSHSMSSMGESVPMGAPMDTTRTTMVVRNIQARSWGLELDASYQLADSWRTIFTLTSVRGANDSDNTTLAQLPPLEARLGLYYEIPQWSAGFLWRAIASQDRVDIGKGTIIGQDFGPTDSADVVSINAGWRPNTNLLLTAGIDNLLNKSYAEHVSRAGAGIANFPQLTRVNEPGRTLWLKGIYRL